MVSRWMSSGLLGGKGAIKQSSKDSSSGKMGTPRCLPWGDKFDTVSCNRLWICCATWIMCSPLVQGLRNEHGESFGSLCWMTPPQLSLTWISCGCGLQCGKVLHLSLFVWGRMDVHSLWPEVTLHTQNSPPLPDWGGVCANLASEDEPVGCGLPHPECRQRWFSGQLLGLVFLWIHSSPSALFTSL